jgi:hypothetical protein
MRGGLRSFTLAIVRFLAFEHLWSRLPEFPDLLVGRNRQLLPVFRFPRLATSISIFLTAKSSLPAPALLWLPPEGLR